MSVFPRVVFISSFDTAPPTRAATICSRLFPSCCAAVPLGAPLLARRLSSALWISMPVLPARRMEATRFCSSSLCTSTATVGTSAMLSLIPCWISRIRWGSNSYTIAAVHAPPSATDPPAAAHTPLATQAAIGPLLPCFKAWAAPSFAMSAAASPITHGSSESCPVGSVYFSGF